MPLHIGSDLASHHTLSAPTSTNLLAHETARQRHRLNFAIALLIVKLCGVSLAGSCDLLTPSLSIVSLHITHDGLACTLQAGNTPVVGPLPFHSGYPNKQHTRYISTHTHWLVLWLMRVCVPVTFIICLATDLVLTFGGWNRPMTQAPGVQYSGRRPRTLVALLVPFDSWQPDINTDRKHLTYIHPSAVNVCTHHNHHHVIYTQPLQLKQSYHIAIPHYPCHNDPLGLWIAMAIHVGGPRRGWRHCVGHYDPAHNYCTKP